MIKKIVNQYTVALARVGFLVNLCIELNINHPRIGVTMLLVPEITNHLNPSLNSTGVLNITSNPYG
jgi:hypothetical protein